MEHRGPRSYLGTTTAAELDTSVRRDAGYNEPVAVLRREASGLYNALFGHASEEGRQSDWEAAHEACKVACFRADMCRGDVTPGRAWGPIVQSDEYMSVHYGPAWNPDMRSARNPTLGEVAEAIVIARAAVAAWEASKVTISSEKLAEQKARMKSEGDAIFLKRKH